MTRDEISQLLPGVFQRTLGERNPLGPLLAVMEALHAPTEAALAGLDATFDPRRTADNFVPFLARWVDLDRVFDVDAASAPNRPPISTGLGRLRELAAAAAWLSKWRGTARGLQRFLHIATGEKDFEIAETDASGGRRLFHVTVFAPESVRTHRGLIERIIESEKPAYVTAELIFREVPAAGPRTAT
jgi:phage tail-like protein